MEFINKSQIFGRLYFSDFVTHIWENVVVQLHSHVRLFATPWTTASQASPSYIISQSLLNLTSIELMMPFNHLILCCPLLLLTSVLPSIRVFSGELVLSHQVAKVLELQYHSFQWTFRTDILQDWLVWSPCCLRDSQESFPTPQFKSINSSLLSFLYRPTLSIHTWPLDKT